MKRILSMMAGALVLLAVSCTPYKYETVKGDPLETKIYTLDNGLRVYMSVNEESPRIKANIAVKVGGKNDPSETTGLAHYFEHLMFKGTEQFGTADYAAEKPLLDQIEALFEVYRTTTDEAERAALYHKIDSISYLASDYFIPNEYDKLMSFIGSEGTNAFTTADMTFYVEDIPSNQIENWAKIQADRFSNAVIRGFHTELETVYEEKNMSLTKDFEKALATIDGILFPDHPYGTQTVLGTQEHLKNPSIINIKNYYKKYYVPNNMAICVSGDFNPDEMVAIIEKYFGGMQPNEDLGELTLKTEFQLDAPVEKEVYGLDAEAIIMGWKYPGAASKEALIAEVAASVLYNGTAGLIDLNINQEQKVLGAYGMAYTRPDACELIIMAYPKQGQTLDEAREIMLEEVAKLRNGEFDEELLAGTVNNLRLARMKSLESNDSRAEMFVNSFINGTEWKDEVEKLDNMSQVTKEDIIKWAEKYLRADNYAIVYKRQGEDKDVIKVTAPKITPIKSNRDTQSAFLAEITGTEVEPIEPVFVDYEKSVSKFNINGLDVTYVQNNLNDLVNLTYQFNFGKQNDPALELAVDYLEYLGTPTRSAEEIAEEMYQLACSFYISARNVYTSIDIEGLSENIPAAMEIVEDLIYNAVPDEEILESLKEDMLKEREDAKLSQDMCFSALQQYMFFGPDYIKKTTLTDKQISELTSEDLLSKIRRLMDCAHEVSYYGPASESQVENLLRENHRIAEDLKPLEKVMPEVVDTHTSEIYLVQYDTKQIYYMQYSNNEEKLDIANDPYISLYNEYFGNGMNCIVFQEMREARALAYNALARLLEPEFQGDSYKYFAFIATQNDKMKTAIQAFDEIINDMPESETAFNIAKEALITTLRTQRITGHNILFSYQNTLELGLTEHRAKKMYEVLQNLTLEDVKETQKKWVEGRTYHYGILGDIKDLDTEFLHTLGPVKTITLEEIFGY
jgi:predicted Zn-dependent peptidase